MMHISVEPLDGIELQSRNYNCFSFLLLNLHFNAGIIRKPLKKPRWHMFRISDPHPTHANLADSLVKSQTSKNRTSFECSIFQS